MAEISKTYASPGLRWGLYKHDHPKAKKPQYEVVTSDALGLPPQFGGENEDFTGLYVLCTIDPADGGEICQAWKEIPKREKTRNGYVAFAQTPEHWRKLCTMALGRTLKEAGYPDDTDDLKALLLWRRRSIELEMLAAGGPLAELPSGTPDNRELDAAAKPTPNAEHHEHVDDDDPVEGEVVITSTANLDLLPWSEEAAEKLRPVVAQMTEDTLDSFLEWAAERGDTDWSQLTGGRLRTAAARATSLVAQQGQLVP